MSLFIDIKEEFGRMYEFYRGVRYIPAPGDNRAVGRLIWKVSLTLGPSPSGEGGKAQAEQVLKESEIIFEKVQGLFQSVFLYSPAWVKKNYKGKDGKWRTITLQLINSEYEMIRSNWYEKWNEKTNYNKDGHKKVNHKEKTQIEKTIGQSVESLLKDIIPEGIINAG